MKENGHSNIPLTPPLLVPIEEALASLQYVLVQRATVTTALRPLRSTILALG